MPLNNPVLLFPLEVLDYPLQICLEVTPITLILHSLLTRLSQQPFYFLRPRLCHNSQPFKILTLLLQPLNILIILNEHLAHLLQVNPQISVGADHITERDTVISDQIIIRWARNKSCVVALGQQLQNQKQPPHQPTCLRQLLLPQRLALSPGQQLITEIPLRNSAVSTFSVNT